MVMVKFKHFETFCRCFEKEQIVDNIAKRRKASQQRQRDSDNSSSSSNKLEE